MSMPTGSYSGGAGGGSSTGALKGGESAFDSSGWSVVFGQGNSLEAKRTDAMSGALPYVLGAIVLVLAWRMTRAK